MNGKGDKPRPLGVSKEQFDHRWDQVFLKEIPEYNLTETWSHRCKVNGLFEVGISENCSWCGQGEDGSFD